MNYILILIVLFCGYKIYSNQGQKRFDWFICSMMIFASNIIVINHPQIPCHRMFMICYWLSVLKNKENRGIVFPLKWAMIIYIFVLLGISFHSLDLSPFYKIYKPFVFLLETYFILLLTRYGVKNETFYSKKIIYTLFFVMLYGVFTLIIHHNPIQEIVVSAFGGTLYENYYFGERIRITSTWSHPIAYGLVCGAIFYQYLAYWKERKIQLLMLLIAFNVLVCGSRTALVAFFLMGGIVVLTRYSLGRAIRRSILVSFVLIPVYFFVPMVQEKVNSVINTIQGNDDVVGSSLEMRDNQTYSAMLLVAENPWLGHGVDYINENLGYGTDNYVGDSNMLGYESYAYVLLIERGFVGFFLELFIWLKIFAYAYKNRRADKENASLIIAYILAFAFFSMSTGTLDTTIPMLFMIGTAMSKLSQNKID